MPGTAGFVLTLHESDLKVFRHGDVATRSDVAERVYRVSKLLYDLLAGQGKQLIVRNFFYEPLEMAHFRRGVERLPDDVIVMSKDTTHEFHPFYPWDPLHGQMGRKRQIIEIDLGVEKAWDTRGAYAQTDYVRRAVNRARETKATGVVGRARLFAAQPFVDSHEVNLYAFSRFVANPGLGVDRVLSDWAGARYPARAVPHVVSALKRSEEINHRGRWHLEYWFTKGIGGEWGDYAYIYSRVLQRSRFKWTRAPADRDLEDRLYQPDAETFRRAIAEKDGVVAQVRAAQGDLRQAARYLSAAQLAPLEEDFRFLLDAALLQREWLRAYFAQRMYVDCIVMQNPQRVPHLPRSCAPSKLGGSARELSKGAHRREAEGHRNLSRAEPPSSPRRVASREVRNPSRVLHTMEGAIAALETLERTPGVSYGLDPETGRRHNIDGFVREMRRRVADPRAAAAEDARILELTRLAADVANR